jgi:ribose 1,5-bisphosphokinase
LNAVELAPRPMRARLIYVVGPSGAGKDTLLGFARERLAGSWVMFAHRYITRAPDAGAENHIALTPEEFARRAQQGLFALEWQSHQMRYGVGIEIDAWLAAGCTVVVNGSRAYLSEARERYPSLQPVLVDAAPEVRAMRLSSRGRETAEQVRARLVRQPSFDFPSGDVIRIENSGLLADAGAALIDVLTR